MEPETQMAVWVICHPIPRRLGAGTPLCTGRVSCSAPPKNQSALGRTHPGSGAEAPGEGGRHLSKGSHLPGGADLGGWMEEDRTLNPSGPRCRECSLTHQVTHSFFHSLDIHLTLSLLCPFLKTHPKFLERPKMSVVHPTKACKALFHSSTVPLPVPDNTALHSGLHYCFLLQGALPDCLFDKDITPNPLPLIHIFW